MQISWSIIATILTAVFAIVAAIFQNIEKNKDDKEREKKDSTIINQSNRILEMQTQLHDTTQHIIELNEKLATTQEKLISLQDSAMLEITGGDNIPIIALAGYPQQDGSVTTNIFLHNKKNIPIHNVRVQIEDLYSDITEVSENNGEQKYVHSEKGSSNEKEFSYPNIQAKSDNFYITTLHFLGAIKKVEYIILVEWRNGWYRCNAEYIHNSSPEKSFKYSIFYQNKTITWDELFHKVTKKDNHPSK